MRTSWLALLTAAALALPLAAAADETAAPETPVPTAADAAAGEAPVPPPATPREMGGVPGGWHGEPGGEAIEDWSERTPWGYGTAYLFPLVRGLNDAEIPLWGKIPVYPLAAAVDVIQLPLGAVGGLWGS